MSILFTQIDIRAQNFTPNFSHFQPFLDIFCHFQPFFVTLKNFTPGLQNFYRVISPISLTFCNSESERRIYFSFSSLDFYQSVCLLTLTGPLSTTDTINVSSGDIIHVGFIGCWIQLQPKPRGSYKSNSRWNQILHQDQHPIQIHQNQGQLWQDLIQYLLHPYNPRNQQHPETDSILYKIISPAFKITQILPIGECSFNLCTE